MLIGQSGTVGTAVAAFDLRSHRRITLIWLALTVLTAVTVVALFVTLPVLAALLAEWFVKPQQTMSAVLAWVCGPMLMIGFGWCALRADEVPGEGVVAAVVALVGAVGLLVLRHQNQRA